MTATPPPTPEELRRLQRFNEEISDARYKRSMQSRLWTAIGIGFILSLLMNGGFVVFGYGWGMNLLLTLSGTAWSVLVQFKDINHLTSCAVYDLTALVT